MKKKDFQIAGMGSSNQLIIFKKITIMNMEKVLIVSANGMGDCLWGTPGPVLEEDIPRSED